MMSQNATPNRYRHEKDQPSSDKNMFWVKKLNSSNSIYWPNKLDDFEYAKILSSEYSRCIPYENEKKIEMIKAGLDGLTTYNAKKLFKSLILEAESLPTVVENTNDVDFLEKVIMAGSNRSNNGINVVPIEDPASSTPSTTTNSSATSSTPILRISMFNGPIKRTINNFYNEPSNSSAESAATSSSTTSFSGEPLQKKLNFDANCTTDGTSHYIPYISRFYSSIQAQAVQRDRLDGLNINQNPFYLLDEPSFAKPKPKSNPSPETPVGFNSSEVERLQNELLALQDQNSTLIEEKLMHSQQIADMKESHQKILEAKNSEIMKLQLKLKSLDLKVNELLEIKKKNEIEIAALGIKSEDHGPSRNDIKLKLKSDEINRKNGIIRQLKEHIDQEFKKLLPKDIEID